MGNVATNDVAMAYAREASPGVLPGTPLWKKLEPNNIGAWGNEIATTPRQPITDDRLSRKPSRTDLNQNPEIEADLTMDMIRDFTESFIYAVAIGPDAYDTSAVTSSGYTVAALSSAQAGRITYGASAAKTLVYARGFATAANNGLYPVTGTVAASATTIPVTGLTAETAPTDHVVEVALAGVRGAAGDLKIDASGNLTSIVLDFTTLGLSVGQAIWIGGIDVAHQFFNTANTGFVRIAAITAHKLTLAKRSQAFALDDGTDTGSGGAAISIDLLFGQFIRNVPRSHADYRVFTNQFEMTLPNLAANGSTMYEYAPKNTANEMVITIPLTNKATTTIRFVGAKMLDPTASRAANAAAAKAPTQTESFGTANDIARLRLQEVDETGVTTDFKSLTVTIRNGATGDKVLGTFGPKYVNVGNYSMTIEAEVIMSDPLVVHALNCNHTLGLDFALYNGDGGAYFDVPSGTLGGGKRNFKANESVTLTGTLTAFKDPVLGTATSVSLFPILPRAVC